MENASYNQDVILSSVALSLSQSSAIECVLASQKNKIGAREVNIIGGFLILYAWF